MLKTAVKGLAGTLGYDVIRRNGGGNAKLSRGIVSSFEVEGTPLAFFIENEWDYIQAHHLKGQLYETEELGLIARHFDGGLFLDVGANIGNHTVYMLKVAGAEKVIAFEPNPAAARLLAVNLALNGVSGRVDHRLAGLGATQSRATLVAPNHKDLGSTRLAVGGNDNGGCLVLAGDEALAGVSDISMIKIDTEAMELDVIAGLEQTLATQKPKLFVEVDDANREAFLATLGRLGYVEAASHRRYATNCNYLMVPQR